MNKILTLMLLTIVFSCTMKSSDNKLGNYDITRTSLKHKAGEFVPFTLNTDLSVLTEKEKQMLPLLFEAATIMEDIFWKQAFGDRDALLSKPHR
jgi:hypothetical protein